MAVSGTNSLRNTALRGVSGIGSGIERDAIIEKMTLGTTTKIANHKKKMTSLSWKQEAFQTLSNKILELQDKYFAYSSGMNLKDASTFAKNQITAQGKTDIAKLVSATGSSDMLDSLTLRGVKQLSKKAVRQSGAKGESNIKTNIAGDIAGTTAADKVHTSSNLVGTELKFGNYSNGWKDHGKFTFPASYRADTDGDGKMEDITIDYTDTPENVVKQLNDYISRTGYKVKDNGTISFSHSGGGTTGNPDKITIHASGGLENYSIRETSSALTPLGFDSSLMSNADLSDGVSFNEFNTNVQSAGNTKDVNDTYITRQNMVEYLTGKKLTITLGGQKKEIDLIKSGESNSIRNLNDLKDLLNDRLTRAFGANKVQAVIDSATNSIEFKSGSDADSSQALTVNSNDFEIRKVLGIDENASTKVGKNSSIKNNLEKLIGYSAATPNGQAFLNSLASDGLVINGVKIEGITEDSTINEMLTKINNTKDAGVKASFIDATNQLTLIATESGTGRSITLNGVGEDIFGTTPVVSTGIAGINEDGQNAKIEVSYGNGDPFEIVSSNDTFNLDGLNITVTGPFGYKTVTKPDGTVVEELDPSEAVTFSAKADVDGIAERMAEFIEEYNELVKELNTQSTTRPDKSYGPLTDEQMDEMSETSIENWEKKAKQGLLFNNSTIRDLSMDLQGMLTTFMGTTGYDYEELRKMGIEISDDYLSGGLITFNEAKFKEAMTSEPEKVSEMFAGNGADKPGLAKLMEQTFTPYATKYASRNGNSYGRLIEEAGSEMIPLSISKNQIYKNLQDMQEELAKLQKRLSTEQDRYISQFTNMEKLINQLNSQSSWLQNM